MLHCNSLMSIKVLADNGYTTIFHPGQKGVTVQDKNNMTITITKDALLQGWRDTQGLWHVPLVNNVTDLATHTVALDCPVPPVAVNSVYELPTTERLVRYLHAALGFLTKATLLHATCKGNLITFPGLTIKNITKFFPESGETQKGHMQQQRQGARSTKVLDKDTLLGFTLSPGMGCKDIYLHVFNATKKAMYTNKTGRFSITFSKGNKYIMVAVELDGIALMQNQ